MVAALPLCGTIANQDIRVRRELDTIVTYYSRPDQDIVLPLHEKVVLILRYGTKLVPGCAATTCADHADSLRRSVEILPSPPLCPRNRRLVLMAVQNSLDAPVSGGGDQVL